MGLYSPNGRAGNGPGNGPKKKERRRKRRNIFGISLRTCVE
jgi:hypothetical protein